MKRLYKNPEIQIIQFTLLDVLSPSQETKIPTDPDTGVDFDDDEITTGLSLDFWHLILNVPLSYNFIPTQRAVKKSVLFLTQKHISLIKCRTPQTFKSVCGA